MWAGFTGSWGRRSMRDCVTERLEREGERQTEPSVQTEPGAGREPRRAERLRLELENFNTQG